LDPCSNSFSTVGADVEYCLPDRDGLVLPWDAATIFVNPPYGKDMARGTRIGHWFARAVGAAAAGSEVIMLVPVAPNTRHWKQFVWPVASGVCFLYRSRLKFHLGGVEDPRGAPMACAVVYYGRDFWGFAEGFRCHGAVVPLTGVVLPETTGTLF